MATVSAPIKAVLVLFASVGRHEVSSFRRLQATKIVIEIDARHIHGIIALVLAVVNNVVCFEL